jgi:hypothetical protein
MGLVTCVCKHAARGDEGSDRGLEGFIFFKRSVKVMMREYHARVPLG